MTEASDLDVEILRAWVDARPFAYQEERAALARLTARIEELERERDHYRDHMDDAQKRVEELEARVGRWKIAWSKMHAARNREAEKREELEAALRGLLGEVENDDGQPWDVDQDCQFCGGHYGKHHEDCAWSIARAALSASESGEA